MTYTGSSRMLNLTHSLIHWYVCGGNAYSWGSRSRGIFCVWSRHFIFTMQHQQPSSRLPPPVLQARAHWTKSYTHWSLVTSAIDQSSESVTSAGEYTSIVNKSYTYLADIVEWVSSYSTLNWLNWNIAVFQWVNCWWRIWLFGLFGHKLSCIWPQGKKLVSNVPADDVTVPNMAAAVKREKWILCTLFLRY